MAEPYTLEFREANEMPVLAIAAGTMRALTPHPEQFLGIRMAHEEAEVEDAIARANDTHFGLDASVWGNDSTQTAAVAARQTMRRRISSLSTASRITSHPRIDSGRRPSANTG